MFVPFNKKLQNLGKFNALNQIMDLTMDQKNKSEWIVRLHDQRKRLTNHSKTLFTSLAILVFLAIVEFVLFSLIPDIDLNFTSIFGFILIIIGIVVVIKLSLDNNKMIDNLDQFYLAIEMMVNKK